MDACTTNAVCTAGLGKGTVKPEGTSCGTLAAPALCYMARCRTEVAACYDMDFGSNWMPSGRQERWETPGNAGTLASVPTLSCRCSGTTLFGPSGKSAACTTCVPRSQSGDELVPGLR